MNQIEFDVYMQNLLHIADFEQIDVSQNGLQIANSGKPIRRIAVAVDACLQSIQKAASLKANLLFVHHGFFWGAPKMISGSCYRQIKALLDADMALYAVHLPLDVHAEYGNNVALADMLDLQHREPFGFWRGVHVGYIGNVHDETGEGLFLDELLKKLSPINPQPQVLPFGKKHIRRVALVSGGGSGELSEAIACDADAYITGEIKHQTYHEAYDAGIHVIAAGHYYTETTGVQRVAKKIFADTHIPWDFIDVPTGM